MYNISESGGHEPTWRPMRSWRRLTSAEASGGISDDRQLKKPSNHLYVYNDYFEDRSRLIVTGGMERWHKTVFTLHPASGHPTALKAAIKASTGYSISSASAAPGYLLLGYNNDGMGRHMGRLSRVLHFPRMSICDVPKIFLLPTCSKETAWRGMRSQELRLAKHGKAGMACFVLGNTHFSLFPTYQLKFENRQIRNPQPLHKTILIVVHETLRQGSFLAIRNLE